MVRIINANPGMGAALTEEEAKDFMIGHTIIHIGTVDEKGEPNVVPTGYYFDKESNGIYIPTQKASKKVENLGKRISCRFVLMIRIHHTKELEAREKSRFMKTLTIIET